MTAFVGARCGGAAPLAGDPARYHAGRPPRNNGLRCPADPPTVGRRREVGVDEWGWEQVRRWLDARAELPVGPLFCVIDGPTRGRPWSGAAVRTEFRRLAARAGSGRRFAPHQLRHAHALELAREGVPLNIIQRQLGHANPGTDIDLPPRNRPRGDHHCRAHAARADDVRDRRAATLSDRSAGALRRSRFARTEVGVCTQSSDAPAVRPLRPCRRVQARAAASASKQKRLRMFAPSA